jgi:hypothetical protein
MNGQQNKRNSKRRTARATTRHKDLGLRKHEMKEATGRLIGRTVDKLTGKHVIKAPSDQITKRIAASVVDQWFMEYNSVSEFHPMYRKGILGDPDEVIGRVVTTENPREILVYLSRSAQPCRIRFDHVIKRLP